MSSGDAGKHAESHPHQRGIWIPARLASLAVRDDSGVCCVCRNVRPHAAGWWMRTRTAGSAGEGLSVNEHRISGQCWRRTIGS